MTSASVAAGALAVSAEPMPEHVVLILSGGLDSTVLGYRLRAGGSRLTMLSFDYGQRHRRELEYACRTAVKLTGAHRVVDLSPISGLLAGSSLTDAAVDVPDGHYSDLSMRPRWSPTVTRSCWMWRWLGRSRSRPVRSRSARTPVTIRSTPIAGWCS